jgi:PhnB protein
MIKINPYLNFNGNAEEAFNLYKSIFGGEFAMVQRYGDTPDADKVPADAKDKIMHISLPLGNGNVLMASDSLESMGFPLVVGNNFSLSIDTESEEETTKIFNGLSAGGKVEMALGKTFWGAFFGMCVDKFGIRWMVSYTEPQPQAK